MKTGLLFGVVMIGAAAGGMVGGVTEVWAACVPTKDCATLGYKYTAAQCNGKGVACPFDTTLWSCAASPTLNEDYCCGHESLCKYTGTSHRDDSYCQSLFGMSCYNKCKSDGYPDCKISQESCQTSGGYFHATNCGVVETTKGIPLIVKHTCDMPRPAPKEGNCCGSGYCGYNGTSHSDDSTCQSKYGKSCYNECMAVLGVTCDDMQASCIASGGSPTAANCHGPIGDATRLYVSLVCR